MDLNPSPVFALNRAVVLANLKGAAAGLLAVESIQPRDSMERYYLFHAVSGQFYLELKDFEEARRRLARAAALTNSKSEQRFLRSRLKECEASRSTPAH